MEKQDMKFFDVTNKMHLKAWVYLVLEALEMGSLEDTRENIEIDPDKLDDSLSVRGIITVTALHDLGIQDQDEVDAWYDKWYFFLDPEALTIDTSLKNRAWELNIKDNKKV